MFSLPSLPLQLIHLVLYVECPLLRCLALVEGLPRYRLAYLDGEFLVDVLVHLVDEEQHGDIELYAEPLADVGKIVEEVGVLPSEVYRHYVAVVFHALRHEGLRPGNVVDRGCRS